MKKTSYLLFSLLLILSFCLLFAACGGGDAATSAVTTEALKTTAAATTEALKPTAATTTEAPQTTGAATTEQPMTTAAAATTEAATDAPATTAGSTDAPATTVAPTTTEQPATTDDGLYTIVFSVEGKETAIEVPRGETPIVPDAIALSWETEENYCKILGWDKEIVPATADTTYTANVGKYGLTLYDVRFSIKATDSIVTVQTHEGEVPTPPAGYDAQHLTAAKIGTFTGWDKELVAPTAENTASGTPIVYTAQYSYTIRRYTITFKIGEDEHTVSASYGSTPKCPVNPEDRVKDDITVRYIGWDKEIAKVKEDAVYTAVFQNSAEIKTAKNGAKGVLTMTYDDGNYNTAVWVNQENKKYGLNGSCMMVPNWSGDYPGFTIHNGDVDKWNALFAEGTLEPQNHSMTHERIIPDENWGANEEKWKDYQQYWLHEYYDIEFLQSKTEIEEAFPGYDIICFAPSNNTLSTKSYQSDGNGNRVTDANGNYILLEDGGATKVVQDNYYAIRKGNRGVQSLDPGFDGEPGGWYNLRIRAFKDFSGDDKLVQGKKWLDETVADGNWLIVMCHGITATGGDIKQSLADQFFAYAGEYVASGDLWCATFGDATKYLRERQNTTVTERVGEGVVYVDMKINRTAEDGKYLTESVFNYPLSVEIRVPEGWNTVYYSNAGSGARTATYVGEDGFTYAMLNLTPGADGAVVTTSVYKMN